MGRRPGTTGRARPGWIESPAATDPRGRSARRARPRAPIHRHSSWWPIRRSPSWQGSRGSARSGCSRDEPPIGVTNSQVRDPASVSVIRQGPFKSAFSALDAEPATARSTSRGRTAGSSARRRAVAVAGDQPREQREVRVHERAQAPRTLVKRSRRRNGFGLGGEGAPRVAGPTKRTGSGCRCGRWASAVPVVGQGVHLRRGCGCLRSSGRRARRRSSRRCCRRRPGRARRAPGPVPGRRRDGWRRRADRRRRGRSRA